MSELMLDITARLNQSIFLAQKQGSAKEFALYRRAIGGIMAEILLEVLDPLYREHPGLKPEELE